MQKTRPAVVVSNNDYNSKEDCILIPLTSQLRHLGILVKEEDLTEGQLFKDSKALPTKVFTLEQDLLICCFARISQEKLTEIISRIEENFE